MKEMCQGNTAHSSWKLSVDGRLTQGGQVYLPLGQCEQNSCHGSLSHTRTAMGVDKRNAELR